MSKATRYWVKPGLEQLLFERPPDIPFNHGQSLVAVEVVKATDYERLVAELARRTGCACDVCWTMSWEPIEKKDDANGVNVKTDPNGYLARCGYCWHEQAWQRKLTAAEAALATAQAALKAELDGAKDLRDRFGAKENETFPAFVERLSTALACVTALQKAIDDEPELPGEMPDEMWDAIKYDRDAMAEAMREVVRQTKLNLVKVLEGPP